MHLQLQWHESAQCFSSRAKKWQNSAITQLKRFLTSHYFSIFTSVLCLFLQIIVTHYCCHITKYRFLKHPIILRFPRFFTTIFSQYYYHDFQISLLLLLIPSHLLYSMWRILILQIVTCEIINPNNIKYLNIEQKYVLVT